MARGEAWDQLSDAQKIKRLRDDLDEVMRGVEMLGKQMQAASLGIGDLYDKLKLMESRLP